MKDKLRNLIKLLLEFHKVLLDLEKEAYENRNGQISSSYEYLQLVVNHDDFRWLRGLSEIITSLDLESEKPAPDANQIKILFENINNLFVDNNESEFSKRYHYFLKQNGSLSELENTVLVNIYK